MPLHRSAAWFARVHEALYTGLEGRAVQDYGFDTSDAWNQSRTPLQWRRHLEFWVDLGGQIAVVAPAYQHSARLVFACRYHADDDSMSQARLHAAARDATEYLLAFHHEGGRVLAVQNAVIDGVYDGGWVEVTINFTLQLPR